MAGWINHRQVEAFHVVMLTGSMTSAGELLGISQPGVSRLIRELETKVGFPLFQRGGGTITPTPEAVLLHRQVDRSIQALERIERVAREIAAQKTSQLRIASTVGMAAVYLGQALRKVEESYPETTVSITIDTASAVAENLLTHHYDAGIGFFIDEPAGLRIVQLPTVDAVCVLPAHHPLVDREVIQATDLTDVPLVCLAEESLSQYRTLSVLRAANVDPTVKIEANLAFIVYQLVQSGLGAAIVEPITAKLMDKQDIVIKPFLPTITFNPGIALPTSRSASPAIEALCGHLKEFMRQDFG